MMPISTQASKFLCHASLAFVAMTLSNEAALARPPQLMPAGQVAQHPAAVPPHSTLGITGAQATPSEYEMRARAMCKKTNGSMRLACKRRALAAMGAK